MKNLKNLIASLLVMVYCFGVPIPSKPVVKDSVKISKIIK
jgi:hypothetical protein